MEKSKPTGISDSDWMVCVSMLLVSFLEDVPRRKKESDWRRRGRLKSVDDRGQGSCRAIESGPAADGH